MVATRTLILAVPGTQDTRELELGTIREAVARGEIALDNWAWSPAQNEWLPLAQLPEYMAVAEAPVVAPVVAAPVEQVVPVAQTVRATPAVQAAPVRTVISAQVSATHQVADPTADRQMAGTYYSRPIQEHHEFPIFKILFFVLGIIIAALIVVNYCMVDQPLRAKFAKTSFSKIQVHAHLGAFMQPNALLVHVIPSSQITDDNFADFLTALTQSAPRSVIAGRAFDTFGLTSKWLSEYVITSGDWDGFADMSGYSLDEKKKYVLEHLERADGSPVYVVRKNEKPEARRARENQIWDELVSHFQSHGT